MNKKETKKKSISKDNLENLADGKLNLTPITVKPVLKMLNPNSYTN